MPMKPIYLILVLVFASIGFAALPDIVTDPATRDVIEYLDAKTNANVVVVSSVAAGGATTTITATCPEGKYVMAGSCYFTDADGRACGIVAGTNATWPWKTWIAVGTGTGAKEAHIACATIK